MWKKIRHFFIPSETNAYRPHILRKSWLFFFLFISLAVEGFLVANLVARQSSQNFLAAVVPGEVIALTNTERAQLKVSTLKNNSLLNAAAQAKASDMATKGYFSHVGPDGKEPWGWISHAGYDYEYAGENLAVRFIDSADVVNAWMASPTHRANIVKPIYDDIGVGVASGMYNGHIATFVVQYFGSEKKLTIDGPSPSTISASFPPIKKTGRVKAAEVGPVTEVSLRTLSAHVPEYLNQYIVRVLGEPRESSNVVLGSIAVLLLVAVCITFAVHIQIQSTQILAGGTLVAVVAFSLLTLNSKVLFSSQSGSAYSASVAESGGDIVSPALHVVIDSGAVYVERTTLHMGTSAL